MRTRRAADPVNMLVVVMVVVMCPKGERISGNHGELSRLMSFICTV